MAVAELAARGLTPSETPDDFEAAWLDEMDKAKSSVAAEHEEVVSLGGLYVLGTERHDSRRIDNQLRGRSGRQGDPGESRFYLSLGDDLMQLFNAHMVESIMDRLSLPEDTPIESKMVSRSIRSAQTQIEQQNFEIRKNVLKYDEVLNKQRTVIYDERRRVLMGEDLHEQIRNMVDDAVEAYVRGATAEGYEEEWDLEGLWNNLKQLYPVRVTIDELSENSGGGLSTEFLIDELVADAQEAYDRREDSLGLSPTYEDADGEPAGGEPVMRELERRVLLSVLDRKWREHLYEMDYLQEGIGLRGYGQRDPLVEYQREAFDMFGAMMEAIKEESVGFLFYADVNVETEADAAAEAGVDGDEPVLQSDNGVAAALAAAPVAEPHEGSDHDKVAAVLGKAFAQPDRPANLQYSAPSVDGEGGVERHAETNPNAGHAATFDDVSRNAPCPCGSGRKFKRCHGAPQNS
jgi:preprotein translocase subunit SecA